MTSKALDRQLQHLQEEGLRLIQLVFATDDTHMKRAHTVQLKDVLDSYLDACRRRDEDPDDESR